MTISLARSWTVTVDPSPDSGLPTADVAIDAREGATVGDLSAALGEHLAGRLGARVAPYEDGEPWPAASRLRAVDSQVAPQKFLPCSNTTLRPFGRGGIRSMNAISAGAPTIDTGIVCTGQG